MRRIRTHYIVIAAVFVVSGPFFSFSHAQAQIPPVIRDTDYGSQHDFPPFRIYTDKGLFGFEADINSAILKDSPYTLTYQYENLSLSEILGTIDGEADADCFGWRIIDDDASQYFTLSDPIYSFHWGAYTTIHMTFFLDFEQMKSYKVGVVLKRYPYDLLLQRGFAPEEITVFESAEDAIQALLGGDVAIVFNERSYMDHILVQMNLSNTILYHSETELSTPAGLVMRKGNTEMADYVNGRIRAILSNGEYEAFYLKYFSSHSPLYYQNISYRALRTYVGIGLAALCLLFFIVLLVRYRYRLRLSKEQAFSHILLENASSFVVIWDAAGTVVRTNARLEALLGHSKRELLGKHVTDILPLPKEVQADWGAFLSSRNSVHTFSQPVEIPGKDTVDVLWDISLIRRDEISTPLFMAEGTDITEVNILSRSLEQSLEQLRQSERRLEVATSSGNVAIISYHLNTNEVYISPLGYQILGYTGYQPRLSYENWLNWIHPSDLSLYLLNAYTVENDADANPTLELRIRMSDGEYKWVMLSFRAILLEDKSLEMLAGIFIDINERKRRETLMQKMAFEDPITGLLNRHALFSEAEKLVVIAQKNNLPVGVLIFDIDSFKTANIQKGAYAGDALLKEVAAAALGVLPTRAHLARLIGDQFVCVHLMYGAEDSIKTQLQLAKDFQTAIHSIPGAPYGLDKVTACVGSAIYPMDGSTFSQVLDNASLALTHAKKVSPGNINLFSAPIRQTLQRNDILRKEILEVTKNGQLEVYYQPKVDLSTGELVGAEALARWNHPEFGLITPDKFIPIAEELDVISHIDQAVIEQVCHQCLRWHRARLNPVRIAVNISAKGFYNQQLIGHIAKVLADTGLDGNFLEFELTESIAVRDITIAVEIMQRIHQMGAAVTLDDFGTGYSSLNYLKRLPIDMFKLDRSFIMDIETNQTSQMIVSTITQLAEQLHLSVTVEGIETLRQAEYLWDIGCRYGQGFLFSRPLPASQFEHYLENRLILDVPYSKQSRRFATPDALPHNMSAFQVFGPTTPS